MKCLSIIIPCLNEAETILATLEVLQPYRSQGVEVILADGGSIDGTLELALPLVDRHCVSEPGRSLQMNIGAELATGQWLLFLHADTRLPDDFFSQLKDIAARKRSEWGFFRVKLSGTHPLLRCVEMAMNWRSRWTSVATGDQAIFVSGRLWQQLGGFSPLPLMEDVEFTKRARRVSAAALISSPLVTSSRRWEQRGILKTIMLMWWLRLNFWLGVSADSLARHYR